MGGKTEIVDMTACYVVTIVTVENIKLESYMDWPKEYCKTTQAVRDAAYKRYYVEAITRSILPSQHEDYAYGLVCNNMEGKPLERLCISITNQEHGIIVLPVGSSLATESFPIGSRLRILPNHACATAARHHRYQVLSKNGEQQMWRRITGW
ncbi:hypothetical protein ABD607_003888 [Salmonella enterica]